MEVEEETPINATKEDEDDDAILEETTMVESTHDVDAMASAMVALLAQMDDAASAPPPTVEEEDELPSSMSRLDGEDEDEDEALPTTSKWIPCDPPRPPPPPPPSSGLQRPIRLPQLEVAGAVKKHPSIHGGSQVDGIDGGGLSPSAIGKVLLSPVEVMAEAVDTVVEELPLPGLRTLADLCDAASGAKYARLRLQSTCRRVGLLKRLADKHIETVPESPCASRFSSFTSSTSSSLGTSSNTIKSFVRSLSLKASTGGGGGGSLGAVREAARDAVGCSTWEAAFTGKALARSP